MANPQFITTPSGEELVILGRDDYDKLVRAAEEAAEDAADAAAYARAKADLQGSQPLPADISALILKGNSRLTAIRKVRGKSQLDVAKWLGVSQGHLSDLETGRRKLTPDLISRLADHFNVPESWLD